MATTPVFSDEQIASILDLINTTRHTQYIGARYVPIFGRKGETSIEWDNSAPYEPLTIVLHQGNSYTSRQYVPTGIDILNEDFWANTGNYNAQIEQYRAEVAAYNNRIQTNTNNIETNTTDIINNKKTFDDRMSALGTETDEKATNLKKQFNKIAHNGTMVVFGDSIAEGFSATPRLEKRFTTLTANALNMVEKNYAVAGASFAPTYGQTGNTIQQQTPRAIADNTYDHNDVSLIILEGGINNGRDFNNYCFNGIKDMITRLRPEFPNAYILVMLNLNGGQFHNELIGEIYQSAKTNLQKLLESNLADGVIDCTTWLNGAQQYSDTTDITDLIHPNTQGHAYIAGKLISILKMGINPSNAIARTEYGSQYVSLNWNDTMEDYWDKTKTTSNIRLLINNNTVSLRGALNIFLRGDLPADKQGYMNYKVGFYRIAKLPLTLGTNVATSTNFGEIDRYDTNTAGGRALLIASKWYITKYNNEFYLNLTIQYLKPESTQKIGAGAVLVIPIDYDIPIPTI